MNKNDFEPITNLDEENLENNSKDMSNNESFDKTDEIYQDNLDEENSNKDYIDRQTAFEEEPSLMDSLLSDVNDLENDLGIFYEKDDLSTSLDEENEKEIVKDTNNINKNYKEEDIINQQEEIYKEDLEPFKNENEYNEEIEEPYQNEEPFEYKENEEELDFDDSQNYYNDAEIASRRKKLSNKNSNLSLKIIVGIIAIIVIIGLAFIAKYFINNKDKLPFNKQENIQEDTIETNLPSLDSPIVENNQEKQEPDTSGIEVETEIKDEQPEENKTEKISSFLQTFTGYIVDINNKEIYVSDKLTNEQETLLKSDFDSYLSDTNTIVYISENQYNEIMGITSDITNIENQETNGPIIIGGDTTVTQETSNDNDNKYYHIGQTCESQGLIDMKPIKISELTSDFTTCPDCGLEIGQASKNAIDYDYSLNPDLASIIYKKFNIEAESLPVWTTIGSKVTISYIQNEETFLNDVIEVSRAKNKTNENTVDMNNEDSLSDVDDYRISSTNIFGEDFDAIVATIEDRRRNENQTTGKILDDELSLAGVSTKDSVSADLALGSCEYVWIQIVWKKNKETPSIPDIDEVTVELQTPQGSLINDSNIDGYGKKWINKKVINYVLKNPKVGNWKVLFTKNVGDYLGDVTIQAAPMTGFLQIKKAAAKYTEGKLKVIWQATGVIDDNCIVQIYARNGENDILLYAGNTIDDNIHTVDMVDIDSAKIAGNIYDIVIKVQDIDVTAGTPKKVAYKFITDEYIIPNVEVPDL